MDFKLVRDIAKGFDFDLLKGSLDVKVNDVVSDSRKASKDNIFICIVGAVSDGHKFIKSALEAGCRAFVIQNDVKDFEDYDDVFRQRNSQQLRLPVQKERQQLPLLSGIF